MANVAKTDMPYKIPFLIFGIMMAFHMIVEFSGLVDLSIVTSITLVVSPLAVSISCFIIAKIYGMSKVFGKSYLLLGLGFFSVFVGELIYFHFVNTLFYEEYSIMGDFFFLASYPFKIAHIFINICYFVDRLTYSQKYLLCVIPVAIILGYSAVVFGVGLDDVDEFIYSLIFVITSSIVLALTVVAFTLFRKTVLISAWFVLLIGIAIGTVGDILYNYAYTLGAYSFSSLLPPLWIASSLIMIYALYKHQQSV